ncbi:MAG: FKBP-type peptidyl-prolyl cis-trans isomerase [Bacteroides sp.]
MVLLQRQLMKMATLVCLGALIAAVCGCKKEQPDLALDDEAVRLDAYRDVHYPDAKQLGDHTFYKILRNGGSNEHPEEGQWLYFDVTALDLEGNLLLTSSKMVAKNYSTFDAATYYTPYYKSVRESAIGGYLAQVLRECAPSDSVLVGMPSAVYKETGLGGYQKYQSVLCYITPHRVVRDPAALEATTIQNYLASHPGFNAHDKIYRAIVKDGDGATVEESGTVWVTYAGYHLDGFLFDTNSKEAAIANGTFKEDAKYNLLSFSVKSDSKVIQGFSGALTGLKIGAKVKLLIPSSQAYGESGSDKIRPYTPLLFEITVVRWQK